MSITYLSLLRAPMVTMQMLMSIPVVLRAKLDRCSDHDNLTSLRHLMYNWHAIRSYDLHSMEALAAVHMHRGHLSHLLLACSQSIVHSFLICFY